MEANREQLKQEAVRRREEHLQRIPIEGKFGQARMGTSELHPGEAG